MEQKVGRNDPCPCGSGLKYKHCCYGKEVKKTYTSSGKRKFSAKVISTTGKSEGIFQSVGTAPPMPTVVQPYAALKFRMTKNDYRVYGQGEVALGLPFAIPRPGGEFVTPSPAKSAPQMPEVFEATRDDYRCR